MKKKTQVWTDSPYSISEPPSGSKRRRVSDEVCEKCGQFATNHQIGCPAQPARRNGDLTTSIVTTNKEKS